MIVGDQPRWLGSAAVRPSRRPLRGLLRMRFFFDDTINRRHPERLAGNELSDFSHV